jgi:RHS repeat-associated protein
MNVYSKAFDYYSYIGGSVDMRTGQYGCQITLATLFPQGPLEVSREVKLGFSMLGASSGLYGNNWRLSNTEFDVATSRLTLLTGEQFKTQSLPSVGGWLVIEDRKLKDLAVKREDTNTLHVIHKDGPIEILRRTGSTSPYRIVELLYENGERFTWRYEGGIALTSILNHNQEELLHLTYSNGRLEMADVRVEGNRYARTRFLYSTEGRLTHVSVPYDSTGVPATAGYTFRYTRPFYNGLVGLEQLITPMGGGETVRYVENGHQYGNGQYIPRVASWVQTAAAGQPDQLRTYSYSTGRNFTGYPFSGGFKDGEDNLLAVEGDYFYSVEESRVDVDDNDKVLVLTSSTYNKFHLLTEEAVLRGDTRTITSIVYNMVPGQFSAQSANFQLPKIITKRYERAGNPARVVVEHFDTDDYGNEVGRTEASGVRTERSYYPVVGMSGKCPAEPHGLFLRYISHERLIPAGNTSAAQVTEYTYTRLPLTGARYFVLQRSCSQAGAFDQEHTYYETPVDLAGRLKTTSCTLDGLQLISEFSYDIKDGCLVESRSLKGREGQSLESQRTLSLVNRRLLSTKREGDCVLSMAFDVSGRLLKETTSSGQPQQAGRAYAYHFATGNTRASLQTSDALGNQVITRFDGLGRTLSEAQLVAGGVERPVRSWFYDALGQVTKENHIDHLAGSDLLLQTVYFYNSWGNRSKTARADGSVLIDDYDPQLHTRTTGLVGGEQRETQYNEHNQPIRVSLIDTLGNKLDVESRTYDGWGRCVSRVDCVNHRQDHFYYDGHNRVVRVLETPDDGSPARERRVEYALGTSGELATAIFVDGKELGRRSFDSLGRLTLQCRGQGTATQYGYETNWTQPVTVTPPGGIVQSVLYDKQLDVKRQVSVQGQPDLIYDYDPITGHLTRSTSSSLVHELFTDALGYPSKEVHTVNGVSSTAEYEYSPEGRLLRHLASDGQVSQLDYDQQGRFFRLSAGLLRIEQSYDAYGRPQTLITNHGTTQVVTRISYDPLGREAERRFEREGALLRTLTSTYHPSSLLASRFMRDANGQTVLGEIFTYDPFGRLTDYQCQGYERPQDPQGRDIAGQQFTFDLLNNITRVVTTFVSGSEDICERYFEGSDPVQLTRQTHSNPPDDQIFTYDMAGNMKNGPRGQAYTFDAFDQLSSVTRGGETVSYEYYAEGQQALIARGDEPPVSLVYVGNRLDALVQGDKQVRYFSAEDQVVQRSGGVDGPQLHINDAAGSVRGVIAPGEPHISRHYTPYGATAVALDDGKTRTLADLQVTAFNSERLDFAVNLYHLGNGQRAYDPELMVFLSADPFSPFLEGGDNAYCYGNANPTNVNDPSGLLPNWLKWTLTGAALAMGVLALGVGVAGIAAAGAAFSASQVISVAGSALGIVGSTLSMAALGIEAVDEAMGWDRSHHLKGLGWASFAFSIASWGANVTNAWSAAQTAYKTAQAGTSAARAVGGSSASMQAGMRAGIKSIYGRTFKFGDKPTTVSKTFGSTRQSIKAINLSRSLVARYNDLDGASLQKNASDDGGRQQTQAQPQQQWALQQFVDTPQSAGNFFESFQDEAWRVRQSILKEVYQGDE